MKKFIIISILILMIFDQTACRNKDDLTNNDNLTIVTSFYPIYITVMNITKDIPGVEVINMTKPQTGCLHDYQLSPNDLKMIEKADAFIINGAGMESFMDDVISQQENLIVIDASEGIELLKNDKGEDNPHVWVSITELMKQVDNISEGLRKIDPTNSGDYLNNGDIYSLKLEGLRQMMHSVLDPIKKNKIITFHEAFPYFAKEFMIDIAAVIEKEPGEAPSPKELEYLIDTINNYNIKALFAEPQYSFKAAESIAIETGAKIYILDPVVTGISDQDVYDDYIHIMENNLKVLKEAFTNGQ